MLRKSPAKPICGGMMPVTPLLLLKSPDSSDSVNLQQTKQQPQQQQA
jgi:hypothetical protein